MNTRDAGRFTRAAMITTLAVLCFCSVARQAHSQENIELLIRKYMDIQLSDGWAKDVTVDSVQNAANIFVVGTRFGKMWCAKFAVSPYDGSLELVWERFPGAEGIVPSPDGVTGASEAPPGAIDGVGLATAFVNDWVYLLGSRASDNTCYMEKINPLAHLYPDEAIFDWTAFIGECYAKAEPGSVIAGPGASMVVDSSKNLLIGASADSNLQKMKIIKLKPNGTLAWTRTYEPGEGISFQGVTVDSYRQPILIGETPSDIQIVRSDENGGEWNWTENLEWTGLGRDRLQNIQAVGTTLYGAGQFNDGSDQGIWMGKWNDSGEQVWMRKHSSNSAEISGNLFHDFALGSACGPSFFVAGSWGNAWIGIFETGSGGFLESFTDNNADEGEAIAVDSKGRVYMAGKSGTSVWVGSYYLEADCNAGPTPGPGVGPGIGIGIGGGGGGSGGGGSDFTPPAPPPPGMYPPGGLEACDVIVAPNPFSPRQHGNTYIVWKVSKSCSLNLTIYDALGDVVASREISADPGVINWAYWRGINTMGREVMQGMYYVKLGHCTALVGKY